tara:strand:+ start:15612 stop:16478 length:867 start_codon:yes stop_codon:yes gene_type:complete
MKSPLIQWYPGHIAKAEKKLNAHIHKIDLVIEVRDARIPLATGHPHLRKWIKDKKHMLVINRSDMINNEDLSAWDQWFRLKKIIPCWCNAKLGNGIEEIKRTAIQAGMELNERRVGKGMKPRSVRALTLGFPNVGKSALINRLTNKKIVQSSRRAGATKTLRWVRINNDIDLLDAPGVIPPRLDDQNSAIKLAICDDIGEASYESESICIEFLKLINNIKNQKRNKLNNDFLENRYGIPFSYKNIDIYQWLENASKKHTSGNTNRMAHKILDDYRKKLLGLISLENPL